ncbi:RNA methyltransferase [Candidatus Nomurabacteria bacterium]|nr:RNA methyltransferase [Candidatus Nomurabacteria bacterium]
MLNIVLILHNIRSAHNVGSIFRTAEGAGLKKVYLTGYTPMPKDKFERVNKEIAKTALGAEKIMEWRKFDNLETLISKLKKENFEIVALEQDRRAVDYRKAKFDGDIALILGNEVGGVDPEIIQLCDHVIEIPMRGEKESLNVGVAAGIAIFRLLNV